MYAWVILKPRDLTTILRIFCQTHHQKPSRNIYSFFFSLKSTFLTRRLSKDGGPPTTLEGRRTADDSRGTADGRRLSKDGGPPTTLEGRWTDDDSRGTADR